MTYREQFEKETGRPAVMDDLDGEDVLVASDYHLWLEAKLDKAEKDIDSLCNTLAMSLKTPNEKDIAWAKDALAKREARK